MVYLPAFMMVTLSFRSLSALFMAGGIVAAFADLNSILSGKNFQNGECHVVLLRTITALASGETGEGAEAALFEVQKTINPKIKIRQAHDPSYAWPHEVGPSMINIGSLQALPKSLTQ
jgi:hypothetical protein